MSVSHEPRYIVLLRRQFADRPERLAEILRREGVDDVAQQRQHQYRFPLRLSGWYLVLILGVAVLFMIHTGR